MTGRLICAALLACIVWAAASASRAQAYAWPTWLKRAEISGCIQRGNEPLYCGCAMRYIQRRVTASAMVTAEHRISVGASPGPYILRVVRNASYACAGLG